MNTLRHKIKVYEEQVYEILITSEIRLVKGRFQLDDTVIQKFRNILESFADLFKVKVLFDDYCPKIREEICGMKL